MVSYERCAPFERNVPNSSSIPIFPREKLNCYDGHSEFEMLLGKEKAIFNHSGNKRFRSIINHNVYRFSNTSAKSLKTKLVRKIYHDIQKAGYRFLKREDKSSSVWNDIKEAEAHEKISHALRDRVRELRKPLRKKSTEATPSLITAMAKALKQNNETVLAMKQLERLRDSMTKSQSSSYQPISYDAYGLNPKLLSGNPQDTILSNVLNKAAESSQSVRFKPTRRISSLGMGCALSSSKSCKRLSLSSIAKGKATNTQARRSSMISLFSGLADKIADGQADVSGRRNSIGKGKATSSQTRRSSMISLFNGLADKIADVQTDVSGRRHSLFQDTRNINDDSPLGYITLSNLGDESYQANHGEEVARLGRRLSLIDGFDQKNDERRLSMLSSFSGFSFQ